MASQMQNTATRPAERQNQRQENTSVQNAPNTSDILPTHPLLLGKERWMQIRELSKDMVESGFLPKAVDTVQKAFIIALKGNTLGVDPLTAWEEIGVINGKTTISGKLMLRLIYERCPKGVVDFITPKGKENEMCVVRMGRPGREAREFTFTLDDAKKANLFRNPSWNAYTRVMLRWRAIAEGARVIFSDIIQGAYLAEELGAIVDTDGKVVDDQMAAQLRAEQARQVTPAPETKVVSETSSSGSASPAPNPTPAEPQPEVKALPIVVDQSTPAERSWDSEESQKQAIKLLFMTARNAGWSEEDLRQYLEFQLGKSSTKDLNWAELNTALKYIEANQKGAGDAQ